MAWPRQANSRTVPCMARFAVVGAGFRASIFWAVAAGAGLECVGAVVRSPRELPVPSYGSLHEVVAAAKPDFVLVSTAWAATPVVARECVERGLPVVLETPPAPDAADLTELWHQVGASGLVQVAEQYPRMPLHAARLAAVRAGAIGTPTQVHVSSTQTYHAMALVRAFLGVRHEGATVRAVRFEAPLVQPLSRAGWTDDEAAHPAGTILATYDFGAARSALYDFTDNQTRNLLRTRRLLVRGTSGEINDDLAVRLTAPRTIQRQPFLRRQTGHDLEMNTYGSDHIALGDTVFWRNPFPDQRWNDDEIAVATLLADTASWVRDEGPPPYPLAEAATDHLLTLAVATAVERDEPVHVAPGAWA